MNEAKNTASETVREPIQERVDGVPGATAGLDAVFDTDSETIRERIEEVAERQPELRRRFSEHHQIPESSFRMQRHEQDGGDTFFGAGIFAISIPASANFIVGISGSWNVYFIAKPYIVQRYFKAGPQAGELDPSFETNYVDVGHSFITNWGVGLGTPSAGIAIIGNIGAVFGEVRDVNDFRGNTNAIFLNGTAAQSLRRPARRSLACFGRDRAGRARRTPTPRSV